MTRKIDQATSGETTAAARMPSLAWSSSGPPGKARPAISSDTVKPMPGGRSRAAAGRAR